MLGSYHFVPNLFFIFSSPRKIVSTVSAQVDGGELNEIEGRKIFIIGRRGLFWSLSIATLPCHHFSPIFLFCNPSLSSSSFFLHPLIVQVDGWVEMREDIHRWPPQVSPRAPLLVTSLMMEIHCSCLTPSLSSDPTIHILPCHYFAPFIFSHPLSVILDLKPSISYPVIISCHSYFSHPFPVIISNHPYLTLPFSPQSVITQIVDHHPSLSSFLAIHIFRIPSLSSSSTIYNISFIISHSLLLQPACSMPPTPPSIIICNISSKCQQRNNLLPGITSQPLFSFSQFLTIPVLYFASIHHSKVQSSNDKSSSIHPLTFPSVTNATLSWIVNCHQFLAFHHHYHHHHHHHHHHLHHPSLR